MKYVLIGLLPLPFGLLEPAHGQVSKRSLVGSSKTWPTDLSSVSRDLLLDHLPNIHL